MQDSWEIAAAACGEQALNDLASAMRDYCVAPLHLPQWPAESQVGKKYRACCVQVGERLGRLPVDWVENLQRQLPQYFSDVLSEAIMQHAIWESYHDFRPSELNAKPHDDRVFVEHPDLKSRLDGDGLLQLDGMDAQPAAVFYKHSALHYHPLLRRHFTSGINADLIQTLISAAELRGNLLRIAIDSEHLMPASEFTPTLEHDHWYGPPLSERVLDDPHVLDTTMHADPESGLMHEYPCLFVRWQLDKEGRKVVQIEELSEHGGAFRGGYRLLRYLHAIRDIDHGHFVHCDGAVRAYDAQAYALRSQKSVVTGRESATRYRKLFRLDGVITTAEWSTIVARWFNHNRLASEYLESLGAPT